MMAATSTPRLIERLPPVRGRLVENAPLAPLTWFRVGGPAEILFRPADPEDLAQFLAETPDDVPVTVIGVSSNLLVRDGGVAGVVVRLGKGFAGIAVDGETISAGAAAFDVNVALTAANAGLGGLEFLSGIPGTIGGALRMNAGAYGTEIADMLLGATALDRRGNRLQLAPAELGLGYRRSAAPEDWIYLAARLRARKDAVEHITARMAEIQARREASQPVRARTGGSTFANAPEGRAWELIDRAGCRGLTRGGAMVSEQHTNFLINTGDATAADLEGLGEEVRRRVFETCGVTLHWEIRRIGRALSGLGEVSR